MNNNRPPTTTPGAPTPAATVFCQTTVPTTTTENPHRDWPPGPLPSHRSLFTVELHRHNPNFSKSDLDDIISQFELRLGLATLLDQEGVSAAGGWACLLPTPKGASCANYARCVNQILQNLNNMQLWLRIPLDKSDDDAMNGNSDDLLPNVDPTFLLIWGDFEDFGAILGTSEVQVDSWETWNCFRLLCEHHSQLSIALDVLCSLPSANSLGRWFGEPVRAAIIHTNSFLTNARGYPCLSKRHQRLMTAFFNHSIQIVVSGTPVHNLPLGNSELAADHTDNHIDGTQRHSLRPYLDYVSYLYQKMDPLPEQERFELGYRDFLQSPLQPLMDNLEAQTYETFEKDTVKYSQYERAVSKALLDRISEEESSTKTTVLMVVGAGRGPLVRASLQAAEETGRKLRVYAVEKNPNAVITLHNLVKLEGWENIVTIVSCDMRCWDAPEKADILVSELLGSFGDNELSPECLDGAQRFLKADGISIPSSYTSFIQPVTTSKLYNDVKSHKDLVHFETAYVVKLHRVARLAPSQPVFTFTHPEYSTTKDNQRYKKLQFEIPHDSGSVMVHGFAGYFDATLYKDVHLGIEPSTATPNMFSWLLSLSEYNCNTGELISAKVSNIFPIEDTSVCTTRFAFRITALAVLWFNQGLVRMVRNLSKRISYSQQQWPFVLGWSLGLSIEEFH
ncbi:hypothetical protein RHSIM_Rhsim07G0173800 [Rhododendron simsii]|uniref:Protein arginine N-methyltransferase n=1 Tax=Rhododendron simsii TaxID=118357 RepID=A0A834GP76_RHOSS|nr:hypothetical protein RHSIM_Rhsim07G0173800 [Rhododendron simsii]